MNINENLSKQTFIMWGLAVVFIARPIIKAFYLKTFECLRRLVKHFKFRWLVHHYFLILKLTKFGTWVKNPKLLFKCLSH